MGFAHYHNVGYFFILNTIIAELLSAYNFVFGLDVFAGYFHPAKIVAWYKFCTTNAP